MMKVSDPIIFGHVVSVFYKDVLTKHADALAQAGFNPNNGIGDLYARLKDLPAETRRAIEADIKAQYEQRPQLAMVNSDKGITSLHVPSDVIVDASMPAMIRESGKMWGADGAAARRQGRDSGPLLRGRLSGGDRRLQEARRVRSGHDGHGAERRPDGASGRRIRLARQDLPDPGERRGSRDATQPARC